MRVEYLNPFLQATNDVFKMMLDLDVQKKGIKLLEKDDYMQGIDTNVILGLTGDLSGNIMFGFSKNMALEMVKTMSGMEIEEINSFVSSALGEVANIISGNAMTLLQKDNYNCDIAPPRVLVGEYKSFISENEKPISLEMATAIGDFNINLLIAPK